MRRPTEQAAVTGRGVDPGGLLWRLLGSPALAVAQLGLLGVALVAGALSLLPVYGEWWFRLLLAWMALSLGVYALGRWAPAWGRDRVGESEVAYALPGDHRDRATFESAAPAEAAAERLTRSLRGIGYSVRRIERHGVVQLRAERHRWYRLALLASHLGVVVVLVAAVGGSLTGFRDPRVLVPEGATVPIGHGTGLAIRNDGFASVWYPDVDVAKDFVTRVTLLKHGTPVRRGVSVRVNHPLSYEGTRVYQSFFGPSAHVRVWDAGRRALFAGGVPLPLRDGASRPAGSHALPGYTLWVLGPRLEGSDALVPPGQVRLKLYRTGEGAGRLVGEANATRGEPVALGGLTVSYEREGQYSGFEVTRNRFAPVVWGGVAVALLGLLYLFYLPYREVRARISPLGDGAQVTLGRGGGRAMGRGEEWDRVTSAAAEGLQEPYPAPSLAPVGEGRS